MVLSAFFVTSAMFMAALGVASETASADIPFPVVASSARHVRVDIGVDRTRAQAIRRAVVLTPTGTVPATLVRTRRVCKYLCGPDDGRECHFEAVLKPSQPARDAIAVFPAGVAIAHVAPLTIGQGQPIGAEQTWIDAKPIPNPGGDDKSRWGTVPRRFADRRSRSRQIHSSLSARRRNSSGTDRTPRSADP